MKFLVVLSVAVACVAAASVPVYKEEYGAAILKHDNEISPTGDFQYNYETSNGIYVQAQGVVKNPNAEYPSLEVKGAYKYTAPEGTPVELSYEADENGYRPQGNHLPIPPPTPEYIARALAFIAANPPRPEEAKPSYPVRQG